MSPSKESWSEQVKPLLDEIRRLVRLSDLSQRQVEKMAGFSKGYLSQLLGRNLDLKLWHVLAVLSALDVEPGDFFARAFPRRRSSATSKPGSLIEFAERSEPISDDMDRWVGRLYRDKTEALEHLHQRLERCEDALGRLQERGLVVFDRADRGEDR